MAVAKKGNPGRKSNARVAKPAAKKASASGSASLVIDISKLSPEQLKLLQTLISDLCKLLSAGTEGCPMVIESRAAQPSGQSDGDSTRGRRPGKAAKKS